MWNYSASLEAALYSLSYLFQTHFALQERIHVRFWHKSTLDLQRLMYKTHQVEVEALSSAIINCTTSVVHNSTVVLIEGLQVPHSGVLVHDSIVTVKDNRVWVPVFSFFKIDIFLNQPFSLVFSSPSNVIGPK